MNILDTAKNNKTVIVASIVLVIAITLYFTEIELKDNSNSEEVNNLEADTAPEIKISKGDDPMLGDPNAPLSIIEFSDYQCPFCARFYVQTLPLLKSWYIETGEVNFVYRDFPIPNHPNAMPAAVASECADDQGKFWEYHDILFIKQDTWKKLEGMDAITAFKEYALELNLDAESFDSCFDSGKYVEEVNQDLSEGRSYKISGTPTFFIGNEEIGYSSMFGAKSFSDFQTIIEEKQSEIKMDDVG
ncbi:Na antiporter NhaA 2 protein [Marine Group I thaumarchaeote SCGC AAA799-E16]|uniref:Na antiporter NhaA 2 protein n=5 Tax=Marine Group I TaxID=905826 RepID=A0A087S669_9ARCH|nr:Na antiporter NhaA 2 protein [Marine Group I thaumarchaeote SCGC AAA799-E16]KFM14727.1 Na antiporter NhaA 2 protein [Marine Group I thaumarchaeote SCGC AAA799-D11]KFM16283.1 Na antiporter NhaA 2 protein [Marine Group I thaumarchaeote SCGC RSA3]KFM20269.1 Na antiporter NhaA 2 protein [Marine Group I thaumarchaeote SCGC AAA799-P11]KFM21223.1 Na antiporter NhaA 2 protein [Marine Group I thaumarchaeote SCGC AAA799-B03]